MQTKGTAMPTKVASGIASADDKYIFILALNN
jgi:hypothetical protein